MNESEYKALIEQGWRRSLTVDEQARVDAWLATDSQQQADWEMEVTVSGLLAQLPNAPMASNFTSQVMRAVERDLAAQTRRASPLDRVKGWFRKPVSRLAWALGLVAVGWFGIHQHQTNNQHQANMRSDMAKGLSVMANVASLSNPSVLRDFEAIRRLNGSEDEELFAVLTTQ